MEMRGCTENLFLWSLRAKAEGGGGDCSPDFGSGGVAAADSARSEWRRARVRVRVE